MAHSQHGAVEFKRLFGVFATDHGVVESVGFHVRGGCLGVAALTDDFDLSWHILVHMFLLLCYGCCDSAPNSCPGQEQKQCSFAFRRSASSGT